MKYKTLLAAAGFALFAVAPQAAKADAIVGYTNGSVDLLAGPADTYPSVAHVDMGANVPDHGLRGRPELVRRHLERQPRLDQRPFP